MLARILWARGTGVSSGAVLGNVIVNGMEIGKDKFDNEKIVINWGKGLNEIVEDEDQSFLTMTFISCLIALVSTVKAENRKDLLNEVLDLLDNNKELSELPEKEVEKYFSVFKNLGVNDDYTDGKIFMKKDKLMNDLMRFVSEEDMETFKNTSFKDRVNETNLEKEKIDQVFKTTRQLKKERKSLLERIEKLNNSVNENISLEDDGVEI